MNSNQITFIVTSPQHKCLGEWNSYERAPDSKKQKNTKKQQFTYIFTDCTEDNVQNTHTYTQYTQCTIKTYLVINTHYTPYVHIYIMYTSMHSNVWRCNRLYIYSRWLCKGATDYKFTADGCATDSCAKVQQIMHMQCRGCALYGVQW